MGTLKRNKQIRNKVYRIQGKNYCLKELSIQCGVDIETLYRRIVRNNALPKNKQRTIEDLSFNWSNKAESFVVVEGKKVYRKDYLANKGSSVGWDSLVKGVTKCPDASLDRLKLGRRNVVYVDGEFQTISKACKAYGVPITTLLSRIEVYPNTPTEELLKNPPNANRGHNRNTVAKANQKFMCGGVLLTRKQIAKKFNVTLNTVYRLMRKHPDTSIENLFSIEGEYSLKLGECKTRLTDINEEEN